ncbi:hypothetical protein POM88_014133 [Heracleum sosnowskyi]|uniref:Uncharacterized protein n=1 Tax=Heracleum sosnowskyi TaxID=360622 RepID=A0AAD8IZU6_9APIA|nr:hypothetical protein POM88_014133 [Heracleum sosnowskyi]
MNLNGWRSFGTTPNIIDFISVTKTDSQSGVVMDSVMDTGNDNVKGTIRKRGRPRKAETAVDVTVSSDKVLDAITSVPRNRISDDGTFALIAAEQTPPKRGRGRPRKFQATSNVFSQSKIVNQGSHTKRSTKK